MDVLMGPTFSIDVSAAQAADYSAQSQNNQRRVFLQHRVSAMLLEPGGGIEESAKAGTISISTMDRKGLGMVRSGKSFDDSSDSSSSVGAPDDSEEEEEEGEESNSASSSSSSSMKKSLGSLGSLDALEDSLPVKRGLSNYFTGKSKSFASLADASLAVSKAKDLEKPEHPFNKRRRILMANKWTRRSSFYSWTNPKSMPLLTLNEDEDDDEEAKGGGGGEQDREDGGRESMTSSSSSSDKDGEEENEDRKRRGTAVGQRKLQERKFNNSFKCHSCFSLTDLQQQQRLHQNLQ